MLKTSTSINRGMLVPASLAIASAPIAYIYIYIYIKVNKGHEHKIPYLLSTIKSF